MAQLISSLENKRKGIYTYMPIERFLQLLKDSSITLTHPTWSTGCEKNLRNSTLVSKKFLFDDLKLNPNKCYVQCWTGKKNSDEMWKAYTNYGKRCCVKICSTLGKIESQIKEFLPVGHYKFIIDKVLYSNPSEKAYNTKIVSLIEKYRHLIAQNECFGTSVLLTKSNEFSFEEEIRIIAFLFSNGNYPSNIKLKIDIPQLINRVELDPWSSEKDEGLFELLQSQMDSILPKKRLSKSKLSKPELREAFKFEY